ncbi:hypothetical protein EXIGLDRAFT_838096 [Exidia glandulosa HHB12029]|uniref:Aminoglycoside phosphotransferase domain-containing protein n=1 Tax=Exidia glandulosa HHB12029 TaxID=1314781 RepID=A0A165G718_EXIGL|nr:hypothetical protein EXIGLDRAFT_838096 [Exidia glandulosa HHB12029]
MTPTPVSESLPVQVRVVPNHSEAQILAQAFNCSVDEIRPDSLTGVDIEALARSACAALELEPVTVEVTLYRRGTFNILYRLHFTGGGVDIDVLARIPTSAFREHGGASVASTVANMLFAQHVCNIPVPRIISWNQSESQQVPYIITELIKPEDAYEVWPAWLHEPLERQERIFESFARTQAVFLRPREFPLSSIGSLSLKRGGTGGASTKDYVLEPLTIRHPNALSTSRWSRPKEPFIRLHSVVLRDVWFELLEWHSSRCLQHTLDNLNAQGQEEVIIRWNRETLPDPEDIISAPTTDFLAVVDDLRSLVTRTLDALDPSFLEPCLVRTDYAFRNALLGPHLDTTKACVDFDDVQICPLVLAHIIPQDLLECESYYIPRDHPFYTQEGGFSDFPLDEYGPEDLCPEKTEDEDERLASNNRIKYTTYRSSYLAALEQADPRIQGEGWWEVHRDARKVHELLVAGTHMWWIKREWLRMRRGDSAAESGNVPATT